MLQATQIVLRNHQQAKLDALRKAVLNSTLLSSPEDYYQQMFIRLIDDLTPLHLEPLHMLVEMQDKYEKLPEDERQGIVIDLTCKHT